MRGLEEIYLKGFSYDKYLGIASKDELEKLSYKITVIENLIEKVDSIIIGGGMAFTFLKSLGYSVEI